MTAASDLRCNRLKPFKGVISDWHVESGMVFGTIRWHADQEPFRVTTGDDPIVRELPIRTSLIIKIWDRGAFKLLETRNSFYVLIGESTEEADPAALKQRGET